MILYVKTMFVQGCATANAVSGVCIWKAPKDYFSWTVLERNKNSYLIFFYTVKDSIYFVNRKQLFAVLDIKVGILKRFMLTESI